MLALAFVVLCVLVNQASGLRVKSLNYYHWHAANANNSIRVKASIPGNIYTDLLNDGILRENIYYRFHDVDYRWVAYNDWIYSVSFPGKLVGGSNIHEIVCHGLDGHGEVRLNRIIIGTANNTFTRYRFDISRHLQVENILEIHFESPIVTGTRLAQHHPHLIPPTCVPPDYNGECHINFLRRMQASYGWDWGLAVPSVGIWKPIELLSYEQDLIVRDITVSTVLEKHNWKVTVKVFCDGSLYSDTDIKGGTFVILRMKNGHVLFTSVLMDVFLSAKSESREVVAIHSFYVPKDNVELWWPNGYGSQNLYELEAIFKNDFSENSKMILFGFREFEVVEKPVDEAHPELGLTFYFSVNGVPIFAKGSNYIPHNIFLEEAGNRTTITNLLSSVRETNMNILRVWGGGIYADDFFYQECDRLGILVWQDMMFACSMYPADNNFLASVRTEISQQIQRLQHHPSIILWAGNNENEAALRGNWYGTNHSFNLYKSEYIKLYVETIHPIIQQYDPTRVYMVSSPSNGLQSNREGFVAKNPYSSLYGDVHFYDYVHDSWVTDHYPKPRFSSEYGFQSLPSLSTLKTIAYEKDLMIFSSKFFQHRQHLPIGNLYLIYQILLHFHAPLLSDIESVIYLSQITQAWAIKSQTEWYRSKRSTISSNGEGLTMGAMYWQLNDVWQAPTWSSIEFGGKWKMLHYYAKHFFAPVIIAGQLRSDGEIMINIVSDLVYDLSDVVVKLEFYKWNKMTPVRVITNNIKVKAQQSDEFLKSNISDLIDSIPDCYLNTYIRGRRCFMKMSLNIPDKEIIHKNYLFPSSNFKNIEGLQNPNLTAKIEFCENRRTCHIQVKTNAITLFVWLDVGVIGGHFSDNGFIMTEAEKSLLFYSENYTTPKELQSALTVTILDKTRLDTFSLGNDTYASFKMLKNNRFMTFQ